MGVVSHPIHILNFTDATSHCHNHLLDIAPILPSLCRHFYCPFPHGDAPCSQSLYRQVELWLTKQKLPLSRIAYTLLAILAYTILSWILNYCFGVEFPYRFFQDLLDIRATPGTYWVEYCISMHFFIMSLCIWAEARLRDYLMDRLFPRSDVVIDEP
ncbi:hypothetical protein BASA83_011161 [Batrachochytrium salamandrivorans]|nr:hypothetical protein BASA83_011161 [Batrachochytrium salamandrivorans]